MRRIMMLVLGVLAYRRLQKSAHRMDHSKAMG
jgi:hypothetical protein